MPYLGSIISRGDENRLILRNGQIIRRMEIGNDWNRIRIGVRFGLNTSLGTAALAQSPRFFLGVCNYDRGGVANVKGSPSFAGLSTPGTQSWAFNNQTPDSYTASISKTVNLGSTVTAAGATTRQITVEPANFMCMVSVDINKSNPASPEISTFASSNSITGVYDVTLSAFITVMEQSTPSMSNYTFSTTTMATTFDEAVNGPFDAVNLVWSRSYTTMEISDLYYSTIA